MDDLSPHKRNVRLIFIGGVIFIFVVAPILLFAYGAIPALIALVIGIILLVAGLIRRDEAFIEIGADEE